MDRLRRYSQLNIEMEKHNGTNGRPSSSNPLGKSGRIYVPKKSCKNHFSLVHERGWNYGRPLFPGGDDMRRERFSQNTTVTSFAPMAFP